MYKQIKYWVESYGSAGATDQRAVETFMDCETKESIDSLRNELVGITQGNYQEEILEIILGKNRKVRYSSYQEWVKLMLLWMVSYKP